MLLKFKDVIIENRDDPSQHKGNLSLFIKYISALVIYLSNENDLSFRKVIIDINYISSEFNNSKFPASIFYQNREIFSDLINYLDKVLCDFHKIDELNESSRIIYLNLNKIIGIDSYSNEELLNNILLSDGSYVSIFNRSKATELERKLSLSNLGG